MRIRTILLIAVVVSVPLIYQRGVFNIFHQQEEVSNNASIEKEEALDEAGMIRKVSERPIGELGEYEFRSVVRTLASNRVMGCGEFYGVRSSLTKSEYLVFCTRDSPGEMANNFSHPGWRVITVDTHENIVTFGNVTMHCGAVKSTAYKCP